MKTLLNAPQGIGHKTAYELVQWLDKQYPHLCARPGESLEDIWRAAGARALVDSLLTRLNREELNGSN